jgi:hypothetical protein
LGYYHYAPGSPSVYFQSIDDGTYTWNNTSYRNPTFYRTSSSTSEGTVSFETTTVCGMSNAIACTGVNTTAQYWYTQFRYDIYCYTTGTTDPNCFNAGRTMNHEFGHVQTLDENGDSSSSLVSVVPKSNQPDGGIGSRRCGDNNALYNRYGNV